MGWLDFFHLQGEHKPRKWSYPEITIKVKKKTTTKKKHHKLDWFKVLSSQEKGVFFEELRGGSPEKREQTAALYALIPSLFPPTKMGKFCPWSGVFPREKNAIISDYSLMHENLFDIDPVCEFLTSLERDQQQTVWTSKTWYQRIFQGSSFHHEEIMKLRFWALGPRQNKINEGLLNTLNLSFVISSRKNYFILINLLDTKF